MNCREKLLPEVRFGGFSRVDGTVNFYLRINALITSKSTVLDVGCGRGAYKDDPILFRRDLRVLSGKVKKVIGLDVDPKARANPFVDEFRLLDDSESRWPIENKSVDLIVSDWTLEHVANPNIFFEEAYRVLKPGGYLCMRTTNAWGYIALLARLIPKQVQAKVVQWAQKDREEEDIFPTVYRCNTKPSIKRQLIEHGFDGAVYAQRGEPGYLNFSCLAYFLGLVYERVMPEAFLNTLIIFARKV